MKMTSNAAEALLRPDTLTCAIEMTEELRERFKKASCEIMNVVKANTANPAEGYMLLAFVTQSFGEYYGIRGGIIMEKEDIKAKG